MLFSCLFREVPFLCHGLIIDPHCCFDNYEPKVIFECKTSNYSFYLAQLCFTWFNLNTEHISFNFYTLKLIILHSQSFLIDQPQLYASFYLVNSLVKDPIFLSMDCEVCLNVLISSWASSLSFIRLAFSLFRVIHCSERSPFLLKLIWNTRLYQLNKNDIFIRCYVNLTAWKQQAIMTPRNVLHALSKIWIKIPVVLDKKILNFVNVFSLFRNYLPFEKGGALHMQKHKFP